MVAITILEMEALAIIGQNFTVAYLESSRFCAKKAIKL
jgi:hypothetical protein